MMSASDCRPLDMPVQQLHPAAAGPPGAGFGAMKSSQSVLHRPQVYFHAEFGVSWTSRHIPNSHTITYLSRGLRKRLGANFPREVPASTTNYLVAAPPAGWLQPATVYQYQHGQQRRDESNSHAAWQSIEHQRRHDQRRHHSHHQQPRSSRSREQSAQQHPQQPSPRLALPPVSEERRSSRSSRSSKDSRSSHERGHSEPPPLSGSPWDITAGDGSANPWPGAAGSSPYMTGAIGASLGAAAAPRRVRGQPAVWKALPELPTRYRLGEGLPWSNGGDGLPWSNGIPEPVADPDDERLQPQTRDQRQRRPRSQPEAALQPFANKPTVLPIQAPDANGGRLRDADELRRRRDIESQRKRNLEDLSAAMMTIDNGFEGQWWNQGQRENTDAQSPTAAPPSVWPAGMSSSALPVSLVLAESEAEAEREGRDGRDGRDAGRGAGAAAFPAPNESPTGSRRIEAEPLGWAIASEPTSPLRNESFAPFDRFEPFAVPAVSPEEPFPYGWQSPRTSSSPVPPAQQQQQQQQQAVVSPVSEFASVADPWSPGSRSRQLSRAMSTRSDELFLGRYA